MKTRTPILLASLIIVPLILLAWFGVRLQSNQQELLKLQLGALIEAQLSDVNAQMVQHFARLQNALDQQIDDLYRSGNFTFHSQAIDLLIKQSPQIARVFVINAEGKRLYPMPDSELTVDEQRFLAQTRELLATPNLFNYKPKDPTLVTPSLVTQSAAPEQYLRSEPLVAQKTIPPQKIMLRAPAASYSADIAQADIAEEQMVVAERSQTGFDTAASGWIAWYADTRLHHIYWRRNNAGTVIGFALNGARLTADLITNLPTSLTQVQTDAPLHNAEIRLINSGGEQIYAWGQLAEGVLGDNNKPLKIFPLSHPLGSWRLEYFAPGLSAPGANWISMALLIAITMLGLSVIAWLIYREYQRDMRLAQQRVNFVNQVSHELKTPLTNVRMYAEMLEQSLPDDPEAERAQRYVGVISNESQRLSRLIENVLSFSRLGRGNHTITPIRGIVADCVETVIENFAPMLLQRGLKVAFTAEDRTPVLIDCGALEQILNNLLSNCEKYAANSGDIRIHSWIDAGMTYLRVTDNGPGIPKADWHKVFTPFYRCSNQLTDGVTGTGIGLGLAREIARSHGGDLVIEASDQGASFLISLRTDIPPQGAQQ
ncbi:HAMP domain-containing sensor histidine kinase [Pontibacterium granulatum]|uniref:sensor histidine kinase n=1 Tax=Pontibacterium granulatum TaxID=2036029 RepID=UPI00249B3722|nr:HAMP domain-containing sensor histidine kinase [Pontibacterium granulatum]MDI3324131.1 HAMP domain-containing sensor histidine kinase [Pontibacterium granulatum]